MRPFRICVSTYAAISASAFYRATGPLLALPDTEIRVTEDPNWADVLWCDMLFILRPHRKEHERSILDARFAGKPVWVDHDDDFFRFPVWHSVHADPTWQKTLAICTRCTRMADVATYSTAEVRKSFEAHTMRYVGDLDAVVPNALPDWLMPPCRPQQRSPVLAWRGSTTHEHDLEDAGDVIVPWLRDHPDWDVAWFGHSPWWSRAIPEHRQAISADWADVLTYLRRLCQLSPEVVFVPLEANEFNQGKSNIAWLEATAAGAICLASPVAEFVGARGCLTAQLQSWPQLLSRIAEKHLVSDDLWSASREEILSRYVLSVTNVHRQRIVEHYRGQA